MLPEFGVQFIYRSLRKIIIDRDMDSYYTFFIKNIFANYIIIVFYFQRLAKFIDIDIPLYLEVNHIVIFVRAGFISILHCERRTGFYVSKKRYNKIHTRQIFYISFAVVTTIKGISTPLVAIEKKL